ncbi:RagB/SusD family nutrient uptake outer membrane protein [Kriegella aquimaris]|uniref:Starch-binding associating with outer membrane n=1 Tax=Kriegella aquimaris TaxID=192904 RepID=A0A1G9LEJ9_9FLAO|nr:RagB/SusD family nutrient uptake outer membrane protein [Kriegella aquimaris]SDL60368.1 Starch-binding associating with outer membrane [Kriegella aquimaris]
MKNRTNFKIWASSLVALLCLLSCDEDFVTKDFKNGVVDENFFQNATHAEQALTAVYDIVGSKGLYREAINVLGDCPSDDILELTGDNGDYGTYFRASSDFRWFPDNPFSTARWYDAYKGIFRANILLEKLPEIDMDAGVKDRFAAEAKFLRALYYFNLVTAFGDVPFSAEVLTREEYAELGRTDRAVIYAQMEQDLKDAADVLPPNASDPVGRVTKGAANGLLSRVYLYQSKWDDAAAAAKKVIDQNKYKLVASDDYVNLFNGLMENSEESLFEFQSVGQAPAFWSGNSENFYSVMWSPVHGWANWFSPSPSSYEQFTDPNDVRRKASILLLGQDPPDMIDVGKGEQEEFGTGTMRPTYFHNASTRKWLPEGKDMTQVNNYEVNFLILRYAEILLNYAEAQNEAASTTEAVWAITQIRERAGISPPEPPETDQASLRELIRSERRKELLFEGHRFYDLQRWGIANEVLSPFGYVQGTHEFWPVPTAELDLMPNLTQYP